MKKKLMIPVLLIVMFSACKKDKNCDKSMAAIAGTYSLVKAEIGTGGVFLDFTSQIDACEADDILVLNANGTSGYIDFATVCSTPGDATGTWSINAAGVMTINNSGSSLDVDNATITSFDCSTLVLTGFDASSPGDQFRLTIKK